MIHRDYFESISSALFSALKADSGFSEDRLVLNLTAESTQFVRLNRSKVRQIGTVQDALIDLQLVQERGDTRAESVGSITLTGDPALDRDRALSELGRIQKEVREVPANPYLAPVENHGTSTQVSEGQLLAPAEAAPGLLQELGSALVTGIYASGRMIRANANSLGQSHWFETDQFSFDYSVDSGAEAAVKGEFAGSHWDGARLRQEMAQARAKADALRRAPREIPRGEYRVYLAPAAFADVVGMLNWGCIGEAAIRQGDSPLLKMRKGEAALSPRFTLQEDFRHGDVPRFNEIGELSPESLDLIRSGRLENSLVCTSSAREYGVAANGASRSESMRSPSVLPGTLKESEILQRLGTGLYLSNLHYLNWSDQPGGRITGMTRHACFWVEDGKLTAPIQNLRWDDSIFEIFGEQLEDLTETATIIPGTGTYEFRSLGAARIPGALLTKMKFTL